MTRISILLMALVCSVGVAQERGDPAQFWQRFQSAWFSRIRKVSPKSLRDPDT